jgi:hypothetical protein
MKGMLSLHEHQALGRALAHILVLRALGRELAHIPAQQAHRALERVLAT